MYRKLALSIALALSCGTANAYEVLTGKVSLVQPTALPAKVWFTLTGGTTVCPSGGWVQYGNSDAANNRATYAALLAALIADKTVTVYVADGDTTCTGITVHVIK